MESVSFPTQFRFTKKEIDSLPIPDKRVRVRDTGVSGLILDLFPTGTKTFRVYKKIKNQKSPVNVTLGKYPSISIENARKSALDVLNSLSTGVNPNETKRTHKKASISLEAAFEDYVKYKSLRDTTLKGYRLIVDSYCSDIKNKPLLEITEELIKKKHRKISESSKAQADLVMRFLRAIFNFAKYEYRDENNGYIFSDNPIQILSHQRLWNKVDRKNSRIPVGKLANWFNAIESLRKSGDHFSVAVCDLVEMALFTGLRKSELLSLTWSQVDLKSKTFFISTTKNGDPLELPIPMHLHSLLTRRFETRDKSAYVFKADSDYGVIKEPKKVIQHLRELSGVDFTMHDLRRTFTSTAESLNLGSYTIKRLLNHRTKRDDVTAGYVILTAEELRQPAQSIENRLLELAQRDVPKTTSLDNLLSSLSEDDKQELLKRLVG